MQEIIQNIIQDIAVEFNELQQKNFRKKSFFNQAWKRSKSPTTKGSLMVRSGALKNSLGYKIRGSSIQFFSRRVYSTIHNEGGEITVTRKMKRFFMAMHIKHKKNVRTLKDGSKSKSKTSSQNSEMAGFYLAMALKKEGSKINIPQRQFIGNHPKAQQIIRKIIETEVERYFNNTNNIFKNAKKHI